jgi:hypothetical protein
MNMTQLRNARDDARAAALASAKIPAWRDEYARWTAADPALRAEYERACRAIAAALRGTKYEGANPEYF